VVERTYSEWKSSLWPTTRISDFLSLPLELRVGSVAAAYGAAQLAGNGGDYSDGTPRYYTCQSCHMRPTIGQGCNKNPPLRSDLPVHDLTGGNYWAPEAIQYLDARNELVVGGGLTGIQNAALDAGAQRARQNLESAATLVTTGNRVRVTNLTGHKLISGYPEGRRMWLRVRWRDGASALLDEDGAYGPISAQIDGSAIDVQTLLDLDDPHTRIYEAHGAMTSTWARQLLALGYPPELPLSYQRETGAVTRTLGQLGLAPEQTHRETFHFVLNNLVARDTRIPPYGMAYSLAAQRNTLPVPAGQYGDPGPGGLYQHWDDAVLDPPPGAVSATLELMYQPTSWEYIQFLYLANPGTGFLGAEGTRILDAWRQTAMAAPHVMVSATWSNVVAACSDGYDNDGDGRTDSPADPGCASTSDESEHSLVLPCDDKQDGDGDGEEDFPRDPGCLSLEATTEVYDDGDLVADAGDNCPFEANTGQSDANYDDRGDACECGDAAGGGTVTADDAAAVRFALAGVAPVPAPAKCNAIGPTSAQDADGDGLRDDCNLLDAVVLRRAESDLEPGVAQVCEPALP
jgi:hypothetical protein